MAIYKFGLCLLFFSHQLFADRYWSHIPELGAVQLTGLTTEQHHQLAKHLELGTSEARQWLDDLPARLEALSCASLDAQSQSLPADVDASYKLSGYAGVLKLHSSDLQKKTIWWLPWNLLPELDQLSAELTELTTQVHQPLLITEQQTGHEGQVVIVSGSSNSSPGYFALRLEDLDRPELIWFVSSADSDWQDLTGTMAQPLLMQQVDQKKELSLLSLLLPNTGEAATTTQLYKVNALTGEIQGRFKAEQSLSGLSGAMALFDQNRDLASDSLLFGTKDGQLWQLQIDGDQFYGAKAIADLSGLHFSDIQFIRTLFAAVPVGGSGSDFHSRRSQWLVLLSALRQGQSIFVMLKLREGQLVLATDLVNRTLMPSPELAVLTDQSWQQIQQKNGWYSQFNGRLTQAPIVAAGVLYLAALVPDAEQFCRMVSDSVALMALHLHHGSAVYKHLILAVNKSIGAVQVKPNAGGGFALIEQHQQQVLIEDMLEISPDCTHCSKPMRQGSFPRWQLMGTYHHEEGAYE